MGECVVNGEVCIGGTCKLSGAVSPNNGLPLTQHAFIKPASGAFILPGFSNGVHLLYSWKCNISLGDLAYQYRDGGIVVIDYVSGNDDYQDFPYDDYPVVFHGKEFMLEEISDVDANLIKELNRMDGDVDLAFYNKRASFLSAPRHQFGGEPYLLQRCEDKRCPLCNDCMLMFASIGNENYSNDSGFLGNDYVQLVFSFCASCKVINATNMAG